MKRGDADRWSEALGEQGVTPPPLAGGICLSPVTAARNAGLLPGCRRGAAPATAGLHLAGQYGEFGSGRGAVQDAASLLLAGCTLLASGALGLARPCSRSPGSILPGEGASSMQRQQGGGLHPPSRKQQRRSAGGNFEQVVLERAVIFNHRPGPAGPGSPPARQLQDHPSWLAQGKGSGWWSLQKPCHIPPSFAPAHFQ